MNLLKRESIIRLVLWILIGITFLAIVKVNLFHYNYNMNSDLASDGILARLIWESREWIPSSWFVASETRIFSITNLAALFYGMTENMAFSMGSACVVATAGIMASAWYMCKCVEIKSPEREIFLLTCLILPNHLGMLEMFYLFASYYAPHIIVLFITLGIYAKLLKGRVGYLAVSCSLLLEFLLGMQGVRGILVIGIPIMAVEFIRNLYMVYRNKRIDKRDIFIFFWSIALTAIGFLGGLLPFSIGQNISRNIRKAPQKLIHTVVPDIQEAIGLDHATKTGKILLLFVVIAFFVVFVLLLYRLVQRQIKEAKEWIFLVLAASPLATAVILSFTTVESTSRYFFIFIPAMALSLALLWEQNSKLLKGCLFILTIGVFVLHIRQVYLPVVNSEEPPATDACKVTEYLVENGYDQGYATFLFANRMTMLSNGEVRVAPVDSLEKMNICRWMTSTDWYVPNVPAEKKTAYIVAEYEWEQFRPFLEEHQDTVWEETRIGIFHIYGSDYNYSTLE